jgi:hypothetical protein
VLDPGQIAALVVDFVRDESAVGVVINCTGVEHRAGSIDRWLDSPPQELGDCAPVLSIRVGTSFTGWR